MRNLIILIVILVISIGAAPGIIAGRGDERQAIYSDWNSVMKQQKEQEARWKALDKVLNQSEKSR
ncbi:MAG: hypothetical protein ACP5VS_03980, partial [Desulfomonilaceae bacterium]